MSLWPSRRKTQRKGAASVGVRYASSPLLAAPTPPWRSRLLVALLGLGSLLLVGRAVYIQIIGTDFYLKQGESRYARTFDLPASRGRIIDRNGQILAASVPSPSIWAIPKDFEATPAQRRELARLLGMGVADLKERLADNPNFVWLRRQVDEAQAQQIKQLGIRGIYQLGEYKRKYPEGEAAAHVVGFTNVEERGQEGIELAFQGQLAGRDGTRSVIRDRFGRIVEDIGESVPPADGRDVELSIDSKVQFFAYQRIRDGQYQIATVPEPAVMHGWQVVDELNRAFNKEPPSGFVTKVHLVTKDNVDADGGDKNRFEPSNGYRDEYKKIWGVQ